jgi:K+-transporting ATPase c subunit
MTRAPGRPQTATTGVALETFHVGLEERDGFLWAVGEGKTTVRDRSHLENASKKFEWVAPEEIKEAVYDAVESSFSSSADDVVSVAAGRLGFNRVSAHARELFDTQIELLVKEGRLENREDLLRVPK